MCSGVNCTATCNTKDSLLFQPTEQVHCFTAHERLTTVCWIFFFFFNFFYSWLIYCGKFFLLCDPFAMLIKWQTLTLLIKWSGWPPWQRWRSDTGILPDTTASPASPPTWEIRFDLLACSSRKSSATQCYQWMWWVGVYVLRWCGQHMSKRPPKQPEANGSYPAV